MKIARLLLLMVAVLFLSCSHAGAVTLSFAPPTSSFDTGDPFDLEIIISDLGSMDLSTFDFDVAFDDSLLVFDSYALGDGLGDIALFEADDWSLGNYGSGLINLSELSYLGSFLSQPASFTLATLSFTGASVGAGNFSFQDTFGGTNVILGDELGDPPIEDIVLMDAGFEVNSPGPPPPPSGVPEPGTIILLGLGMACFARMGRDKKK